MPPLFLYSVFPVERLAQTWSRNRTRSNLDQVGGGVNLLRRTSRNHLCCHKFAYRIHTSCYCCTSIDLVETKAREAIEQILVVIDDPVSLVLIRIDGRSYNVICSISNCVTVRYRYSLIQLPGRSRDNHCAANLYGLRL